MFWLLILIFIILLLMFLNFINQKDFITPTFLGLLSFLLASVLILLNYDTWKVEINPNFVFIVILAVLSLIFGSYLIRLTRPKLAFITEKYHKKNSKIPNINSKLINKYPTTIIFILSIILFILFAVLLIKEVGGLGGAGFSSFLRKIYESKFATEGGHFVFHQVEKILIAIAYINYFHLLNLIFFYKKKKDKNKKLLLTIIPILLTFVCIILSTDRNIVLRYFIYALALWILFFQRSPRRTLRKSNRIILFSTAIIVIIMVLAFYALGKMKQYTSNLERMIGIYGGSGLYNFNLYVTDFDGINTYGLATFKSFLNVFTSFGLLDSKILIEEPGFITYTGNNGYVYSSNIYSSLQPFYQDFGLIGIFMFIAFIGFFLEYFYQKTYKHKYGFMWMFYSAFVYPTIFLSIADQFYARLHLGIVYELFWLVVFYYFTYGRWQIKYKKAIKRKKAMLKTEVIT